MKDETKAKIDRANQLFGEMVEARKTHSAFHEKFRAAQVAMGEVNKMLFEAEEVTPEIVAAWKAQMAIGIDFQKNDPPKVPDYKEWMHARDEAVEALAEEAELFLRPDGA